MQQTDLFAAASPACPPPVPTPETVRPRLLTLLREVQEAETMPWRPTHLRAMELVFHNMANWLPADERDRLRAGFAAEIARLRASFGS